MSFEVAHITVTASLTDSARTVVTADAMAFVEKLCRRFEPTRQSLLADRRKRYELLRSGVLPDFLVHTRSVREGDWKVAPLRPDLIDRRVEITGPVERKMIINALNSGANVFMADFEDSNAPTWSNCVDGQRNLMDAVRRTITFGDAYRLKEKTATMMVRPRGWHLDEKHVLLDGKPISASLFDFGLYFFHNVRELLERGTGPYFYLPKMESHLEARLWNDVFNMAQDELGIPRGTIRATVLIETILAAFEMDEILYELREHSAGLNCGRWDYIFSFIKKFRHDPAYVLPDRSTITMDKPFLKAYVDLLIRTCHRRGAHAMGGMAAQIPIKNDPAANEAALEKVRADKRREVKAGHDGTWVAHPGLVPIALESFDRPNQLDVMREDVQVRGAELLAVPAGEITEAGLRKNIDVGVQYLEAWLRGVGCVPIYHLMEDAATAEISRTQLWQWVKHQVRTSDGQPVTRERVKVVMQEELARLREGMGAERKFDLASRLFLDMVEGEECAEFLTTVAYQYI